MAETTSLHPEEKLVRAGLLLDVYGELLTERQRTFMRLHFEEDLSFSDIAREFGITRQAVHDSVKHALRSLAELEETLGLVKKSEKSVAGAQPQIGGRQLVERLDGLRRRIREECRLPEASWIAAELSELVGLLQGGRQVEYSQRKTVGYDV